MKKSFTMFGAAMAFATMLFANGAVADDWDVMQHDYAAEAGKSTISARHFSGGDTDYYHGQIDYQLTDKMLAGFRYADHGDFQEYRATLAHPIYTGDAFYLSPILSYRYFQGTKEGNHMRLGVRAGGQFIVADHFTVWGWHEPRAVSGGDDGTKFIGSKSEAGVSVNVGGVMVGPFVQAIMDEDYSDPVIIAGTKLSASF